MHFKEYLQEYFQDILRQFQKLHGSCWFVCLCARCSLKIVFNLSLSSCSSFLSNLVDTGKEDKNGNIEPNYFYLWCSSSVISNIHFHLKWCFENISCKVFINELHKLMPRCLFVGLSRDGDCSLLAASLYLLGGNTLPLDCFFSFFFFKFITLIKSAEPRFDIRIQNKKEFTSLLVSLSSDVKRALCRHKVCKSGNKLNKKRN